MEPVGRHRRLGLVGGRGRRHRPRHVRGREATRAVVLHVDNPPQRNNGLYAVVELVLDIDQAQTLGGWRLLP